MASSATSASTPPEATRTSTHQFLDAYEREHATTMRVLRAFPADQADFRPHARCKTARELAWIFALERGLGTIVFHDAFASRGPSGEPPKAPEAWDALLAAVEQTHKDFGDLVRATPEEKLAETVKFFTAPKTLSDVRRMDFLWFCYTTRSTTADSSRSTCAWRAGKCPRSTGRRRTSRGCRSDVIEARTGARPPAPSPSLSTSGRGRCSP